MSLTVLVCQIYFVDFENRLTAILEDGYFEKYVGQRITPLVNSADYTHCPEMDPNTGAPKKRKRKSRRINDKIKNISP